MYRFAAFFIAVAVLIGMVFAGEFQRSENQPLNIANNNISHVAKSVITQSDQQLQQKSDQELVDIERKSDPNTAAVDLLPEIKPALTASDIAVAVQKAGKDASETAMRVGQSAEQAMKALRAAEVFVRSRLERQLRNN